MSILHQSLLMHGGSAYQVTNSGNFAGTAATAAYIYRNMGTPTSNKRWTLSMFIKRSQTGAQDALLGAFSGSGNVFYFETDSAFMFSLAGTPIYKTVETFNNTSGFDHMLIQWDSDNATQADRLIIWKNGTRLNTSTNTISSGTTLHFNSSGLNSYIGYAGFDSLGGDASYYGGLIAELIFVDGQIVAPSAFASGATPKEYTGTFGNNGVWLRFQNSGNLGDDSSTNGNDWTNNNVTQSSTVP